MLSKSHLINITKRPLWASSQTILGVWRDLCMQRPQRPNIYTFLITNHSITPKHQGLDKRQQPCMHAKSLQSCPTLCGPMDCSPPGSSVQGNSPCKNTGVGCHALLQGILPIQGANLCLWHLPTLPGGFFTTSATWKVRVHARSHVILSTVL